MLLSTSTILTSDVTLTSPSHHPPDFTSCQILQGQIPQERSHAQINYGQNYKCLWYTMAVKTFWRVGLTFLSMLSTVNRPQYGSTLSVWHTQGGHYLVWHDFGDGPVGGLHVAGGVLHPPYHPGELPPYPEAWQSCQQLEQLLRVLFSQVLQQFRSPLSHQDSLKWLSYSFSMWGEPSQLLRNPNVHLHVLRMASAVRSVSVVWANS